MPTETPFHPALSAALGFALAFAAGTCTAQSRPYYVGVSQSLQHDSNLFRAADGAVLDPGFSRADTLAVTSLIAGVDQPIGRQRVFGSVTARSSRYASNDLLNHTGYGLAAGVDWATVERISGNLNLQASEALRPFSASTGTTVNTQKNLENVVFADAAVRVGVITRWTAEATLGYGRVEYSSPAFARSEYRRQSGSMGVRFRPSSGINFGVALRRTEGRYPGRDDGFTRSDIDLTSAWTPGGSSSAWVRLSPGRQRYDNAGQSDFSGLTGHAVWYWQPTGKLRLNAALLRETNQDSYNQIFLVPVVNPGTAGPTPTTSVTTDSVNTTTSLRLGLDYAASAKITLQAGLALARRTLAQTSALRQLSDSDRTTVLTISARWVPLRSVQVGCEIGRDSRSAGGVLSLGYGATTYGCNAQLLLR